jgi:hypothetical protein
MHRKKILLNTFFVAYETKIVTTLQDEFYNNVESEKMVEIDFDGDKVIRAGDQFGIGRVNK